MTVLEKVKVNKINYEDFIEMVKNDEFKVEEVSYSDLIDKKNYAVQMYGKTKKKADKYNVDSVRNLFNELCAEHGEIINIHTYMAEYMELVNAAIDEDYYIQQLIDEKEKQVYKDIMELRGYSAYKSNLAEVGLKLLCEKIYDGEYTVVADEKSDFILGVDIVLLHHEDDVAHYLHVTKDTKFSMDKLSRKSGKEVTVIDDRIEVKFGWPDEQVKQHRRRFKNHVLTLYSDGDSFENNTVNGVYIFNEDYIQELVEDNYGLCGKEQFDELQYLEISEKQIRENAWGGRTTTYI